MGEKKFFFFYFQNFFSPKIFYLQKSFPLSIFYAFLDVLCHPECSKKFSPQICFSLKIFLDEARHDTMLPSISSLRSTCPSAHLKIPSTPLISILDCWQGSILTVPMSGTVVKQSVFKHVQKKGKISTFCWIHGLINQSFIACNCSDQAL